MSVAPWSRFTDEQARAAFLVDRSVVSAAAAGAGKTQVLAVRYCACLLRDEEPLGPERVLAITFTREAAANLRARVDAVLRAVLSSPAPSFPDYRRSGGEDRELSPAELDHLRRALAALPSAPIGTVDSFCRELVTEHADVLGLDPALRPPGDEGPEWRQCEEEAWSRLRAEMAEAGGGELLELVAAYGESSVRQVVTAAADQVDSLPGARALGDDRDAVSDLMAARASELAALPQALADAVAATKSGTKAGEDLRRIAPRPPTSGGLAAWIGQIAELKATGLKGAASQAVKAARELVTTPSDGACLALLTAWSAEDEERSARRAALLVVCIDRYRRFLAETASSRGLSGFAATAQAALRLLGDSRTARRLAERYRHVLLDEAQDLNRLQGAIVESLAAAEPIPRIFTVGDHRQSIYAFRHAEPELFRGWERTIEERGGAAAPLGRNFRSHPDLVRAVRELFSSPALTADFIPEAIEPGRTDLTAPAVFGRWRVEGEDPARAEAEQVARLIADSVISRRRRPEDHAVILRARTRMREYADALERIGIPVDTDYPGGLYDAQECWDIEAVLRLCLDPNDRFALATAVAGPWGVADAQDRRLLVEALSAPTTTEAATRIFAETALGALVAELRPLLAAEGPTSAVRRLAVDPRLAARYGALPLVRRRIANLAQLAREDESAREALDTAAFIERLGERRRLGADAAEAGGEHLGSRGVRLLTLHAAKGLEWPVVILPELGRPFQGRDVRRFALARATPRGLELSCGVGAGEEGTSLRRALAAEEIQRARRAEEARLFYVGCTRAVEELHLVMSGDEPALDGPIKCCAQWVGLAGIGWTALEPTLPPATLVEKAQPQEDPLPPLAAPPPLPRPRVMPLTELVEAAVAASVAPARPAGDRELRRALGDAAHRALELHGPGMPRGTAERALAPFVASAGDAMVAAIAERLSSAELIPDWAEATVRLREQPFVAELERGQPLRLVSGKCDLLLRGRDGWRLYDYKTGGDAGGRAAELQLRCYAAMAAPHLDGPIRGAWVVDLRTGRLIEVPLAAASWGELVAAWDRLDRAAGA